MMTKTKLLKAGLLLMGYEEVKSTNRTTYFVNPEKPETNLYLGNGASLRKGLNKSNSVPVTETFKQMVLEKAKQEGVTQMGVSGKPSMWADKSKNAVEAAALKYWDDGEKAGNKPNKTKIAESIFNDFKGKMIVRATGKKASDSEWTEARAKQLTNTALKDKGTRTKKTGKTAKIPEGLAGLDSLKAKFETPQLQLFQEEYAQLTTAFIELESMTSKYEETLQAFCDYSGVPLQEARKKIQEQAEKQISDEVTAQSEEDQPQEDGEE